MEIQAPIKNPVMDFISKKFGDKEFSQDEMETMLNRLVDPESKEPLSESEWNVIRPRMSWDHTRDILGLTFQQYIDQAPLNKQQLYAQACSGDTITVESWREQWISQVRENVKRFSPIRSAFEEHGKQALKPVIIAGSGPSLKKNVKELAKNQGDICIVSCLHNFGFFEDNGVKAEYYLNLDAGDITIPEVSEGGSKDADYYWGKTEGKTLLTSLTGNPKLIEKWKGKVLFFNVPIPDPECLAAIEKVIKLPMYFSVGGNALGACLYFAKAVLGGNPICFIGADFSFGYDKKFHSWDSPYDKQFSGLQPATDIFGNRVMTWPSYYNFKAWFEFQAMGGKGNNPGTYVNCTEGGILGAYPTGNLRCIQQKALKDFLFEYNMHKHMPELMAAGGTTLLF